MTEDVIGQRQTLQRLAETCTGLEKSFQEEFDIVAIDCEMVGVAGKTEGVIENALCKVSLVSIAPAARGFRTLLNTWVKVEDDIIDYRTAITGLDEQNIKKLPMLPFNEARDMVRKFIDGKTIVGHAIENDFNVLHLSHPPSLVMDTSLQSTLLPPGRKTVPSLKLLARYWLNEEMHTGVHDSVKDATTALRLYMLHQALESQWESFMQTCQAHVIGSWVPWPGSKLPELSISLETEKEVHRSSVELNTPQGETDTSVEGSTRGAQHMAGALKSATVLRSSPGKVSMLTCLQVLLLVISGGCISFAIFDAWQSSRESTELALRANIFEFTFCVFRAALALRSGWAVASGPMCTELRKMACKAFSAK